MTPLDEREVRRRLRDLGDHAPPFAGLPAAPAVGPRASAAWVLAAAAVVAVLAIVPAIATRGAPEDGSDVDQAPSFAESTAGATDTATPPSGTSSPTTRQGQVSNDEVRAVGQGLDRTGDPNFGKVVLDLKDRQVTVYWKGTPPDDITKEEGMQPNGVAVRIVEVAYSTQELEQAAERLLDDGRTLSGVRVAHVSATSDLSGLVVGYTPETMPTAGGERALIQHLEQVTGGIPVEIEPGAPDVGLVPGS